MCVREKTYITLWTSSLRREETSNVSLQLIKSRHFLSRAALHRLDWGRLWPAEAPVSLVLCELPDKQLSAILTLRLPIGDQEELCLR